ncbi:hypothetical protein JNUCC64_20410 [Streptomyces sp. JNUCC 64]
MTAPMGPLVVFDDESYMYVLKDLAFAEAWWERPDEYGRGFDATARPLRLVGGPHGVRFELTGEEPDEAELRRLVADHYRRHLGGESPPSAPALTDFLGQLPHE